MTAEELNLIRSRRADGVADADILSELNVRREALGRGRLDKLPDEATALRMKMETAGLEPPTRKSNYTQWMRAALNAGLTKSEIKTEFAAAEIDVTVPDDLQPAPLPQSGSRERRKPVVQGSSVPSHAGNTAADPVGAGEMFRISGGLLLAAGILAFIASLFLSYTVDIPAEFRVLDTGGIIDRPAESVVNLAKLSQVWTVRMCGLIGFVAGLMLWIHGAAERSRADLKLSLIHI